MRLNHGSLKYLFFPLIFLLGTCASLYFYNLQPQSDIPTEIPADVVDLPIIPIEEAFPHVITPKSTLFSVLSELDVPSPTIQIIVDTAKPHQNLAQLKPGIRFQIVRESQTSNDLSEIDFRFSAIDRLVIKKINGQWSAEKIHEKVDIKIVSFSGIVTSSLWESALKAKMDPDLISELADIFGWEVDFSREVRVNDRWRITVEEKTVQGQPVGWGSILAAEYENAGRSYQAALYRANDKDMGYFTPEGNSLRKMFLKSPIRYGRITSTFKRRRFHPIMKVFRPHNGVDYGAPTGTPVRTVASGTVTFAQRSGGGGNVIKVRHNSTYETAYKHLSGYAKGIRSGAHVQQGQVIGYVGSTGLSSGPHLHFEFYQNGRYIDPLSKKFPSAEPVPEEQKSQFKAEAQKRLADLPAWPTSTEPTNSI